MCINHITQHIGLLSSFKLSSAFNNDAFILVAATVITIARKSSISAAGVSNSCNTDKAYFAQNSQPEAKDAARQIRCLVFYQAPYHYHKLLREIGCIYC